jgi:hypothetical protein
LRRVLFEGDRRGIDRVLHLAELPIADRKVDPDIAIGRIAP